MPGKKKSTKDAWSSFLLLRQQLYSMTENETRAFQMIEAGWMNQILCVMQTLQPTLCFRILYIRNSQCYRNFITRAARVELLDNSSGYSHGRKAIHPLNLPFTHSCIHPFLLSLVSSNTCRFGGSGTYCPACTVTLLNLESLKSSLKKQILKLSNP